jgi:hypothetical protein
MGEGNGKSPLLDLLDFDTGSGHDYHPAIGLYLPKDGGHVLVGDDNPLPVEGSVSIIEPGAARDAFGKLRVSNPTTTFDSKLIFDKAPIVWAEKLETGGTSTYQANRSSVNLAVTSTAGSKVTRQTRRRFNYQPGKSQLILATFVLGSPVAGIRKRVGSFDQDNGLFLEQNTAGTLRVVRRTFVSGAAVDNAVDQSSWNLDPLDGTGPSGITLDVTKTQILVIDYEWLGVGRVRFGFNIDGVTTYCHEFLNANNLTSVYITTPNAPIRYEIENVSAGAGDSLEAICCSVQSEGGVQGLGITRWVSRPAVFAGIGTSFLSLIGFRLKSANLDAAVFPLLASVLATTAANSEWAVFLNPTVAGVDAASWVNITDSSLQYDISRDATNVISGGTQLAGGFFSNNADNANQFVGGILALGSDVDGVQDELVLAVRSITGTNTFIGGMNMSELV